MYINIPLDTLSVSLREAWRGKQRLSHQHYMGIKSEFINLTHNNTGSTQAHTHRHKDTQSPLRAYKSLPSWSRTPPLSICIVEFLPAVWLHSLVSTSHRGTSVTPQTHVYIFIPITKAYALFILPAQTAPLASVWGV